MKDWPEVLIPDEGAEYARMGRDKFYRTLKSGDIPHYKVGNAIYIRLEDLREWTRQQAHSLAVVPTNPMPRSARRRLTN